jgi:hypothetical protein
MHQLLGLEVLSARRHYERNEKMTTTNQLYLRA